MNTIKKVSDNSAQIAQILEIVNEHRVQLENLTVMIKELHEAKTKAPASTSKKPAISTWFANRMISDDNVFNSFYDGSTQSKFWEGDPFMNKIPDKIKNMTDMPKARAAAAKWIWKELSKSQKLTISNIRKDEEASDPVQEPADAPVVQKKQTSTTSGASVNKKRVPVPSTNISAKVIQPPIDTNIDDDTDYNSN